MPLTLRILLDPSGAYLCLDLSLVCSHLESLFTRIRVSVERGELLQPCADPVKWDAYQQGRMVERRECVRIGGQSYEVLVKETKQNVIMSPPLVVSRP